MVRPGLDKGWAALGSSAEVSGKAWPFAAPLGYGPAMTMEAEDLIELYAATNQLEADRLVLLLAEDGIEAIPRATTMTSFPTSGAWLILVAESAAEAARAVITSARLAGAISDLGEFTGSAAT